MLLTIREIQNELRRANAQEVRIRLDDEFEPEVGRLLHVSIDGSYWHVYPAEFLELLKSIGDDDGPDAIKQKIERDVQFVWHGPAPESRETSP